MMPKMGVLEGEKWLVEKKIRKGKMMKSFVKTPCRKRMDDGITELKIFVIYLPESKISFHNVKCYFNTGSL